MKPIRMKHNYTSELELKSLLIRIKNTRLGLGTEKENARITKYIKWFTDINNKKYKNPTRRNKVKAKLKTKIISLCEQTASDKAAYERFGTVILLMIQKILTKPSFSGYTYKDEFYSDAVYKILKYLNNFDHTKISVRTGINVNAFAYMSEIMHNSILYIIIKKKKESERMKTYINMQQCSNQSTMKDYSWHVKNNPSHGIKGTEVITKFLYIEQIETTLVNEINKLIQPTTINEKYIIEFPNEYTIDFDEYNALKLLEKKNISTVRGELDED